MERRFRPGSHWFKSIRSNNQFGNQLGAAYSLTLISIVCFQLKVFRLGFLWLVVFLSISRCDFLKTLKKMTVSLF